jgi:DNA-directed RNA polymerase subunit RPC12/RpoP
MPIAWQDAEFEDLQTGKLGKPVKSNRVRIPPGLALSPDGTWLTWNNESDQSRWRKPEKGMLDSFVRLDRGSAREVLRFARRWGVFGLCEVRQDAPESNQDIAMDGRRWRVSMDVPLIGEPISFWHMAARELRALLNIAAAAKLGRKGDPSDWRILGCPFDPTRDKIQDARFLVQSYLNEWIELGRVRLRIESRHGYNVADWDVQTHYDGFYQLFGALALQVVLVVSNADALYSCAGCGYPYIRSKAVWKRNPKPDQASYCRNCGHGRAVQDAKKRYRRKMAEARRLRAQGMASGEIAEQLDTKPATVRGWLKKAG